MRPEWSSRTHYSIDSATTRLNVFALAARIGTSLPFSNGRGLAIGFAIEVYLFKESSIDHRVLNKSAIEVEGAIDGLAF